MTLVLTWLGWAFMLVGAMFILIGGIGAMRFPDVYTRLHAAGMTDTIGAGAVLLGLALISGWQLATVKLLMILGFLVFTSPVASHALAKAAQASDVRPKLFGEEEDAA